MKKYIPAIGDIILDNGIPMVVIAINNNEDIDSCSYDREYLLCEERYINGANGIYSINDLRLRGKWVHITGTEFPDINNVNNIAPYEIKPINCVEIRQKKAKTITIYE